LGWICLTGAYCSGSGVVIWPEITNDLVLILFLLSIISKPMQTDAQDCIYPTLIIVLPVYDLL
jgi:hypothetical protein